MGKKRMQAFTHSIIRIVPLSPPVSRYHHIDTRCVVGITGRGPGPLNIDHMVLCPLHGYDLYAPQYRVSHVRNHKISLITIVAGGGRLERHNYTSGALITLLYTRVAGSRKVSMDTIDRPQDRYTVSRYIVRKKLLRYVDGDISCNAATYYSTFD